MRILLVVRGACAIVVLVAAAPTAASASDAVEEIRAVIDRARIAFDEGRFEEAGALYLDARNRLIEAKLPDKAVLLFNAGLAYQRGGACDRAADLFDRFVEADASALSHAEFVARKTEAETCAPAIAIVTRPGGARVWIDQVERGLAPVRVHLKKGSHRLEVVLEGFAPVDAVFEVATPEVRTFELVAVAAPPALAHEPSAEAPEGVVGLEHPAPEPIGPPVLLYGSIAIAAASVIAGSVLAWMVSKRIDDWHTADTADKNQIRSEAYALAHGRNAAFGVAGAAMIGIGIGIWWSFE